VLKVLALARGLVTGRVLERFGPVLRVPFASVPRSALNALRGRIQLQLLDWSRVRTSVATDLHDDTGSTAARPFH
jgi:hypothetical protein